jgi:DNA polymerase-3 subunit alpha
MPATFVHLHQHTEFSLLDSTVRVSELMQKARSFGIPAAAMTDHGNLYGAIPFYREATKAGIKPIIGCEVYMAPGSRKDKDAASARDASYHFLLLAKDERGYQTLLKLVTEAHLTGFYYKPRIDRELLSSHHEGLIATSACLKGEVAQNLLNNQKDKALNFVDYCRQLFDKDFYLEIQDHGLDLQKRANREIVALSRETGVPLVATNDVHYLEKSHAASHDALICIGTGRLLADEERMRYGTDEFYYKSPQEMAEIFREFPDAIKRTVQIAEQCNLLIDFGKNRYPEFEPPAGKTREDFFQELCAAGMLKRYGIDMRKSGHGPEEKMLIDRYKLEYQVIKKTGFLSYFLIVWDFIHYAKSRKIPVGPGRGSGAGSIIAYLLEITDCDPIRYNLLFERFLNPERISAPDFDIDFCYNRRPEVIEYVRNKYGDHNVAQIITFGTMGAKAVVRDVARVMSFSYGEADRLAKMIPNDLKITLDKALKLSPDLKKAVDADPRVQELMVHAQNLEGLARQASVHAAGVVICGEPLFHFVPLTRGKDNEIVTQYSMEPLGDLGLLKMDFLGLKTLTVVDDALKIIEKTRGIRLEAHQIPLDDKKTFDLLNRGDTIAVFQLESGGMRDLCRKFGVHTIDDIFALIALYRPGPMDLIPDYIRRKSGNTPIEYEHKLLEEVCKDTYGIMIYQEQVMQAASLLAGFSLGAADILRRAMGKKKPEEMAKQREIFIKGCHSTNNIAKAKAEKIFNLLEKFAGYGFNKSHSAAYGLITYQTAFLKANHPVEYMAAVMSNDLGNQDKITIFINESREMEIEVLPPDVNESDVGFTVIDEHRIRFGLAAVKNVGEGAVVAILSERKNQPFKSLMDFCTRLDSRIANKKLLESLIKCGAFDFTGEPRARLFAQLDEVMGIASSAQKERAVGQGALFGDSLNTPVSRRSQSATVEWPQNQLLAFEKELLGFYVTGHPLTQFADILERYELKSTGHLNELPDGEMTRIGGIINKFRKSVTKRDQREMCSFEIEDLEGSAEVVVYPDSYQSSKQFCHDERAVFVLGRIDKRDEKPKLIASDILPLEKVPERFTQALHLRLPASIAPEQLQAARQILREYPGRCPVLLCISYPNGELVYMDTEDSCQVNPSGELLHKLKHLFGEDSIFLKIDKSIPRAKTGFHRMAGNGGLKK